MPSLIKVTAIRYLDAVGRCGLGLHHAKSPGLHAMSFRRIVRPIRCAAFFAA
jgi:hypothetical protein